MIQKPLIPAETMLDKLDIRVRSVYIEGEQFVSILDILQYHGNKKNPSQAWKTILAYMQDKQGFSNNPCYGEYQFVGSDGKRKAKTPVMNLDGFMRFVMSADVPEWEHIREWQAKVTADEFRGKSQKKRDSNIEKLQKAGLSDRVETRILIARNDNIRIYKELKSVINRLVNNPDWATVTDAEYSALFGMTAKNLKSILNTNSIRDNLGLHPLHALNYSEALLRDILLTQGKIDQQHYLDIVKMAIEPIGTHLRSISQALGIDFLTGKSLLNSKNR